MVAAVKLAVFDTIHVSGDVPEKNDALVRKVKGAMIYPSVMLPRRRHRAAHLVIPVFEIMSDRSDSALPLPTRIVIGAHVPQTYWWVLGA
jgi:type IV pilus assembly protein PilC